MDFDGLDFDTVADGLYALAPSEFVAARRTAVASAKEAGDKTLAKKLGGLRKPTMTGWALNLLVRSDPESLDELLALGAELRSAQQALRGDELRSLTNRRAALLSTLTDRAASVARERGHELPAAAHREVGQSLTAALADSDIGADLRQGRMLGAVSYSGFGPASLTAVPEPTPEPEPPAEEDKASKRAARRAADARVNDAKDTAREAASELETAAERAENAADKVEKLRGDLTRAEEEAGFAEATRRSAEKAARDADMELVRAREHAAELES
ncbi:MAG: hypothetical protein GX610_02410 [Rhodococcus sp.]|nr:hypothetical protein [Rhodococcus sp. (in: high G+C Gram-positive bacteria)]